MKVTFYGAARTVTGSKHMLTTHSGKKILLDCGLFQSKGTEELNHHFGFNPTEVDYVILSHAHIDHSGALPMLVKQGFSGPIYCTRATYDLCRIMLADSAKIQESDIAYINKKRAARNQEALEPLYSQDDVEACMKLFRYKEKYTEWYKLDDELEVCFTDAGHILGSACVNLKIREGHDKVIHLLFSGDVGRPGDLILRDPEKTFQADYIICESTYGNRLHEPRVNTRKNLLKIVTDTCVNRKGKIIIPAFSLGRTQELVYTLDRMRTEGLLPDIKVYVDSPLSINATGIMRNHPECFNADILEYMKRDADPFGFNNLIYIQNVEDSIRLNSLDEPCIIISSSGMMEAGRIKHHIKNNIGDSKNTILIVGFVPANTLGDRLLKGAKEVKIFGKEYQVKAEIKELQAFSAHADYEELFDWLKPQNPKKVKRFFLVHGEYDAQQAFKERLLTHGFNNIEIPEREDSFDLT